MGGGRRLSGKKNFVPRGSSGRMAGRYGSFLADGRIIDIIGAQASRAKAAWPPRLPSRPLGTGISRSEVRIVSKTRRCSTALVFGLDGMPESYFLIEIN